MKYSHYSFFSFVSIFCLLSYVLWMSVPFWGLELYDEGTVELLGLNGTGSLLPDMPALYYLNIVVYSISYIGLYFRKSWARFSLLAIVLVGLLLAPFNGALVLIGFDVAIYNYLTFLSGVLIALAFFSGEAWCVGMGSGL